MCDMCVVLDYVNYYIHIWNYVHNTQLRHSNHFTKVK